MQNLFEQEATTCREVGETIARIKKLENNLLSFSNFYGYFIWANARIEPRITSKLVYFGISNSDRIKPTTKSLVRPQAPIITSKMNSQQTITLVLRMVQGIQLWYFIACHCPSGS